MTTTDLRNIAIGLAAAIALIVVAGQIAASDSASVSVSALDDKSEARFAVPTISITTIAGDAYINEDEADTNGFTVVGWATDADDDCAGGAACTVTVVMSDRASTPNTHTETCTVTVSNTWTCTFAAADIAGLEDGPVDVTADVSNLEGAADPGATGSATLDTIDPTITIDSSTISDGDSYNSDVTITFVTSESTSNFVVGDVTDGGGGCSLSSFSGSGASYSVVCDPTAEASTTIDVNAAAFTDAAGNGNTAGGQFEWTNDETGPTMTISTNDVDDGSSYNGAVSLTLTSNEEATGFAIGDIDATGTGDCTFSSWSIDTADTIFSVTCTPDGQGTVVTQVAAGVFTDAAGNSNSISNEYDWTHDSVAATISSFSLAANSAAVGDTITGTITADAAGYSDSATTINGVAIDSFTDNNDNTYTVTWVVDEGATDRAAGTTPVSAVFSDGLNTNSAFTTASYGGTVTIDANSPAATTTVSVGTDTIGVGDTADLTITASETGLTCSACTMNSETLSGWTDNNDNTYTATYTVVEGNTDRASGASNFISLVLSDGENTNAAFTTLTESGGDLVIDANSPAATTTVSVGTDTIGVGDTA
ncbi:MAG: Ig-like domain-containing protein, partial [Candidatus Thalassarchaeaceae archaeon]|nr:Ig-like domain-containing protein [Candidatus Thalassarchaeaceae archaeon]